MQLKHNYWYFRKAIKEEVCNKIITASLKKSQEKGTTGNKKGGSKYRNCWVSWIDDKWIYDIINPFIHQANKQAGWNFQWDWNEMSQFTIYKKGHYYGWHVDQRPEAAKNKDKNLDGKIRKLSLTLQLTDRTKYEGGDFQFKWIQNTNKNLLKIRTVDDAKDIGTIIVFPSFIHHQVLPITKGKRESLVNWSIGKPFI